MKDGPFFSKEDSPFLGCAKLKTIRVNLTQEVAESRWVQKWIPDGVEVIYNNN